MSATRILISPLKRVVIVELVGLAQRTYEEGVAEAAKAIGLSIGGLLASLLEALPVMARTLSTAEGEPYSRLAEWADRTSRALTEVLTKEFPPDEVARIAEDLARSAKGLALIAKELLTAFQDPQVVEVARRTVEGFRKGLQAISSPNASDLMRALYDPDVVFALSVLLTLLKALGVAIRSASLAQGARGQ